MPVNIIKKLKSKKVFNSEFWRLLSGKKPPDEINVRDKLNESKVLIPVSDKNKNITIVSIYYVISA